MEQEIVKPKQPVAVEMSNLSFLKSLVFSLCSFFLSLKYDHPLQYYNEYGLRYLPSFKKKPPQ